MTHTEDVDAAIERASRGPRVASDPYWAEVDADDRLLAEEVVLLRDLLAIGQLDQCSVVGNENEGYCRCVRPAGHERHACQHGVWHS